jgi:hypothetical protein
MASNPIQGFGKHIGNDEVGSSILPYSTTILSRHSERYDRARLMGCLTAFAALRASDGRRRNMPYWGSGVALLASA